MPQAYLYPNFLPLDEAHLPLGDRGFRYGDGLFETVAVRDGRVECWKLHHARLRRGLAALRITLPPIDLATTAQQLVERNGLNDGFVRIAISRGVGSHGYKPLPDSEPTILIETMARGEAPPPANLWLSETPKPTGLPQGCKTVAHGLHSTLALLEAADHGCDEALILDAQGRLCETASANLFWLKGGRLQTPSLATGCLPGVTRERVLRHAPLPCDEVLTTPDALQKAQCVFLTNVNWRIRAVANIEPLALSWQPNSFIDELKAILESTRDD